MDNKEQEKAPVSSANFAAPLVAWEQMLNLFEELPEGHPEGTPINQRMIEGLEYHESRR